MYLKLFFKNNDAFLFNICNTSSFKKQEHLYDDIVANPKVSNPLKVKNKDNPGYQEYEMKQFKLKPESDRLIIIHCESLHFTVHIYLCSI